ncbi:MAG: DUF2271 domain-containing protein [Clostridiales bacterium]|nr:DUF2271 domain-containing protein [Clostridiales bacterium]
MLKFTTITAAVMAGLLFIAGCGAPAAADAQTPGSDAVVISFDFQKQSGYASNQFAVWIEDADGAFVKTLYATRFTASGGYRQRPDAIPVWVERSGLAEMDDVDAITGATPKSGALRFVWDLTDADGERVPDGTYRFFVEGTLRWKNQVLFSGELTLDGSAASAEATPQYAFEASPEQPALTDESPERGMITAVRAEYIPPEQS